MVSVLAALAVIVAAFLLSKNSLFYFVAKNRAENQKFSSAVSVLKYSEGENADVLRKYIDLRVDINRNYPALLSAYDAQKIGLWKETADYLAEQKEVLGEKLAFDALSLSQTLNEVVECHNEYTLIKPDILNLMDVFNEINRLHTKGADGKNISFTIAEERAKIAEWTKLSDRLLAFASSIPGGENIYLVNFLAKESQGEISEVSAAIDTVAANGYDENALVRFSGDAVKAFPDISNNSGESVNLLDKHNYESFMYAEICMELVKNLAPYYVG